MEDKDITMEDKSIIIELDDAVELDAFLWQVFQNYASKIPGGLPEVARRAGVSRANTYKTFKTPTQPKAATVIALCKALGITIFAKMPPLPTEEPKPATAPEPEAANKESASAQVAELTHGATGDAESRTISERDEPK